MLTVGYTYKVHKKTVLKDGTISLKIQCYVKKKKVNSDDINNKLNTYHVAVHNDVTDVEEGDFIRVLKINAVSYSTRFFNGITWVNVVLGSDIEVVNVDVHENRKKVDEQITELPF